MDKKRHGLTTVTLVSKQELAALKAKKKKYNDPTAWELYRKEHSDQKGPAQLAGFLGQMVYVFVAFMLFMFVFTKVVGYFNYHDPVVFLVSTGAFVYGFWKLLAHLDARF